MGIEQALNDTLRQAIKDRDMPTANVVRMVKSKLTECTTAKGFAGAVDDPLVLEVSDRNPPGFPSTASAGVVSAAARSAA